MIRPFVSAMTIEAVRFGTPTSLEVAMVPNGAGRGMVWSGWREMRFLAAAE